MHLLNLPPLLSLLALTSALPRPTPAPTPLPLIIWHGLGDRYDADGLHSTGDLAKKVHPGTYVYYIRTDDDGNTDRSNTFFGNLTTQLDDVCEALKLDAKLLDPSDPDGGIRVDALGFSQGGQFLRGLLERCDGLSMRSLVTFGSQHNGIAEFQTCGRFDFVCKGATALVKGNAWTEYVQNKVVPAQYYRPLNATTGMPKEEYLEGSNFLADVNNERVNKSEGYKRKIASLERFVMAVFEEDVTVVPRESGWFAEVNATSGEVTPLRERQMYKEDWLGLRELDEKGGLFFETAPGKHMELSDEVLRSAFKTYFGAEGEASSGGLLDGTIAGGRLNNDQQMLMQDDHVFGCGADEAQAWWDSLTWLERRQFEWEAVWKPWLRGELAPLRVYDKDHKKVDLL
ncbi:uncharacterized protein LTR77_000699 [Saxophila tyrrhenica]|uniref:palmitoyl-protein hydrolase n=1 Tax=Saxophila tyrrhenica TaxID=1690608 RepID=A0AAV9PQ05_9PEZI|nr:hypothetical protein LTR77_000699 [Saxophila tyrrhenica]